MKKCAYCGKSVKKGERDHVFPRCLYPKSKAKSKVQRITVLCCKKCNHSWEDDEPQLRNVLALSGEPNAVRKELWEEKILPSFSLVDGNRRIADLLSLIKDIENPDGKQKMIFPAEDPRVLRVVRKIIRGLSHYHEIESAVPDNRVWCDVLKYTIPEDLFSQLIEEHRESDVIKYRFGSFEDNTDISSGWILTFYERIKFIGVILKHPNLHRKNILD